MSKDRLYICDSPGHEPVTLQARDSFRAAELAAGRFGLSPGLHGVRVIDYVSGLADVFDVEIEGGFDVMGEGSRACARARALRLPSVVRLSRVQDGEP